MGAHRFRFFVDQPGATGSTVRLDADDQRHLRVLRAQPGMAIELVDAAGAVWDAELVDRASARLVAMSGEAHDELPHVELLAWLLPGQRWDALVDGAAQTGVARIVPVIGQARDAARAGARIRRAERVARAAAKQSRRRIVPQIGEPLLAAELDRAQPGVVLAIGSGEPLAQVAASAPEPLRLLVGPPEGLDQALVRRLVTLGWRAAELGPTILRSELAAPVAIAVALQARALAPTPPGRPGG